MCICTHKYTQEDIQTNLQRTHIQAKSLQIPCFEQNKDWQGEK